MYLLHLRPLFVGLPIFMLDGLVLLEPRDLVREQTRRNLRRAAADLRGGEERSYGKVERLFARVGAGGTCIVGQERRQGRRPVPAPAPGRAWRGWPRRRPRA